MSNFNAQLAELYIGYYGRAPEPDGFAFWITVLENGFSVDAAAQDFAGQAETLALYPFLATPDASGLETFLETVYNNLFGRSTDAEGLSFWSTAILNGLPLGTAILEIIRGSAPADKAALANRVDLSLQWHDLAKVEPGFVLDEAGKASSREALALVTPSPESIAAGSDARQILETYFNDAPMVSVSPALTVLPENTDTSSRIKVADIVVTDDDLGGNALSLAGQDAALFEIDGTELFLRVGAALDFEGDSDLNAAVIVNDPSLGSTSADLADFGLKITDVNEPPRVELSYVLTVLPEDADTSVRRKVAEITFVDDALGNNVLSLTGQDAALFEIDGAELFLRAGVTLDFEGGDLNAAVVVEDPSLGTTSAGIRDFRLQISEVNQPPRVELFNVLNSLPEDADTSVRRKVADVIIVDDAVGNNVLSLTGLDALQFEIDGTALFLRAGATLDFETAASLDVSVVVDDPTILGFGEDSRTLFFTVSDVNELPRLELSNVLNGLPEDADTSIRRKVADVIILDDALGNNTLSLAGQDEAQFEIDGAELFLRAGTMLDFETAASFDIAVVVDDPAFPGFGEDSRILFLTVSDVNEAPNVTLNILIPGIPEDADTSSGLKVADVIISDDALGAVITTLSSADAALFELQGTSLFLKPDAMLDFETNSVLDVVVAVDDPALGTGAEASQTASFNISDVNEVAEITLLNAVTSLSEAISTANPVKIADIVVMDDDTNVKQLSLSGADAALFTIVNDNALFLKAGTSLDFEINPQLDVTVEVDDPTLPGAPDNSVDVTLALTPAEIDLTNIENGNGGFVINGIDASDNSGIAVSGAGDVNGDGLEDVIIGASGTDPVGRLDAGASYVVFGKTDGGVIELSDVQSFVATSGGFVINGATTGDFSGRAVSGAGDINGDGLADLIIGVRSADPNGVNSGASYVVFGKTDGFRVELSALQREVDTRGFVINGATSGDTSGRSVSGAGDVNGDGLEDLIVGADYADPNGVSSGASYVIFGKSDGTSIELSDLSQRDNTTGFIINGVCEFDFSGTAVSAARDINGDGLDDIIVGAPAADPNGTDNAGASYVIFGKTDNAAVELSSIEFNTSTLGFIIKGISSDDISGGAVHTVGDVNGDGFADLVVGSTYANLNESTEGAAFVVFGKPDGTPVELSNLAQDMNTAGFALNGTDKFSLFGFSVSGAGDMNGDGLDDIIIGAFSADANGNSDAGASYVIFGKTDGTSIELSDLSQGNGGFVINGSSANDQAGISVHAAGDVNGDGFADLIVGANRASPNGYSSGASFVVFGGDFTGSVTQVGTEGDDMLVGTVALDRLITGLGDDTLIGNGNTDVMRGGAGDDIFGISDLTFADIDGGTGSDTLRFDTNGLLLDLTVRDNTSLMGIERIDLRDSIGGVTFNAVEVQRLSDTSNTLRVLGDANDAVTLSGGDLTFDQIMTDAEGTFAIYRSFEGAARLEVSTDVTVIGAVVAPVELSEIRASSDTRGFIINGVSGERNTGYSISNAGDVNGDGFDDVIVGVPVGRSTSSVLLGSKAFVVFGKTDGSLIELSDLQGPGNTSSGFLINGTNLGADSGVSVSGAGDVNGDGLGDLIFGDPDDGPNDNGAFGAAYVVFGKTGSDTVEVSDIQQDRDVGGFVITGAGAREAFGRAVSTAGDVNGDGLADVIIGAANADPDGIENAGSTYVVFGKTDGEAIHLSSGLSSVDGFIVNGSNMDDRAGRAVSAAGDVNGDSLADVIIGAWEADPNGNNAAGASYVVFGKTNGDTIDLSDGLGGSGFVINGAEERDIAGRSVSAAGDVNGDGLGDIIVGADGADANGESRAGVSYVIFGNTDGNRIELSDGLESSDGFLINGASGGDFSGFSVSGAGDVNGDGFDDIIIGALQSSVNGPSSGASFVVFGKTDGNDIDLSDVADGRSGFTINGANAFDYSGQSVHAGGDVNGDGFADLIVGAPKYDVNDFSGASFVIFGGNFTRSVTQVGGIGADDLIGTNGDDIIFAGTGNDTLRNSPGQDRLSGGNGADEFVFLDVAGQTTILDFASDERDRLDVSAFNLGSFAAVQALLGEDGVGGQDTAIDLDADTSMLLIGVALSDLSARDFIV